MPEYRGARFCAVERGRRYATPLALVLVTLEVTDRVFALDSVPAAFGVTRDPFIVYITHIFAILGLRALYFLTARIMGLFHDLKIGLALVLIFVGLKMLAADIYHVPIPLSLGGTVALRGGTIVLSLCHPLPQANGQQP